MSIKKLHHLAMRCRDSEETRLFYEDFLGLPLVHAIKIVETKTGNETNTLHTFFRLHVCAQLYHHSSDAPSCTSLAVPAWLYQPGYTSLEPDLEVRLVQLPLPSLICVLSVSVLWLW